MEEDDLLNCDPIGLDSDAKFHEENFPILLSPEAVLRIIEALENPPAPNEAARRAAKKFLESAG